MHVSFSEGPNERHSILLLLLHYAHGRVVCGCGFGCECVSENGHYYSVASSLYLGCLEQLRLAVMLRYCLTLMHLSKSAPSLLPVTAIGRLYSLFSMVTSTFC
mmetsp:Transcript_18494/g.29016  ORF Transcript_18494/g.29016 Transcript_18494/m.29016 type:complete len:103 (+) Transcript_18494:665-973(+)